MTDEPPPSPYERPGIRLIETVLAEPDLRSAFRSAANPQIAALVLHGLIGDADREHFAALFLNARHQITHAHIVSIGSTTSATVHPREVFKGAVLANAAAIIVGHNHPSGSVSPSNQDRALEERVKGAGEIMGIPVLDSLIVGPKPCFYSSRRCGEAVLAVGLRVSPRESENEGGAAEIGDACRGLIEDISDVVARQGEAWWNETVATGRVNREWAEGLLGLQPYT